MVQKKNICFLTFDVEEWFQVENLKKAVKQTDWGSYKSTVEQNIARILSVLAEDKIKATFFVLGYIAKRHPGVVRQIEAAGHEVASHGTGHAHTAQLNDEELFEDIKDSKETLESILGHPIAGYRAPNFSVSDRVIDILKKLNFKYDSSYNPFQLHDRYGHLSKYKVQNRALFELDKDFYEFPISVIRFKNKPFPIGGGAYFRIFPFYLFNTLALKKIRQDGFFNFYLHPWEFEPEQPRIKKISLNHRLRHYTGLHKTERRLKKLIRNLKKNQTEFSTFSDYLESSNELTA